MNIKNNGFSLIQVMISLGLLSMVSLGMMNLVQRMTKAQKTSTLGIDYNSTIRSIERILATPDACRYTLSSLANHADDFDDSDNIPSFILESFDGSDDEYWEELENGNWLYTFQAIEATTNDEEEETFRFVTSNLESFFPFSMYYLGDDIENIPPANRVHPWIIEEISLKVVSSDQNLSSMIRSYLDVSFISTQNRKTYFGARDRRKEFSISLSFKSDTGEFLNCSGGVDPSRAACIALGGEEVPGGTPPCQLTEETLRGMVDRMPKTAVFKTDEGLSLENIDNSGMPIGFLVGGQLKDKKFTSSSPWTVPANALDNKFYIKLLGGQEEKCLF